MKKIVICADASEQIGTGHIVAADNQQEPTPAAEKTEAGCCRLRPVMEEDLDRILEWRNADRFRSFMYTDHLITNEEHRSWFERLLQSGNSACLLFEYDGTQAGLIQFTRIDSRNGLCDWGFYLGEPDLPKGTGTIMGRLGLAYAFETLGIRKLCGEALAFNEASIALHQKLGFAQEGRRSEHIFKRGKYEDVLCFGLFKEKWQKEHGK